MHYAKHVFVCTNQKPQGKTCCNTSGGTPFFQYFKEKVRNLNLDQEKGIRVSQSGCLGRCSLGPCIVIYPEGIWYSYTSFEDIDEIIQMHLVEQQKVDRLFIDN